MNLRLHVIKAVFKRNFLSYFSGVIGYLFILAFVGLGSFMAFGPKFFANNLANLDQLNEWFPVLLLFFVPAITMAAWSDERKLGTDELLFTLPASDLEILLGKYAAVVGVYSVALFFSLSHVVVLAILGNPDWRQLFATYFGYWISGCALLSAGMLASILTSSATVAYVLGALICAVPVFIDKLIPGNRLLQGLSISEQFRDFSLGMIPLGGLLYFISLTAVMLYLNLVFISKRHWSGGPHGTPMWLHYLVRACALSMILISANALAGGANFRIDMTAERLYSLSATTDKVLSAVKSDRPVVIQAFISPEVPRDLVSVRSSLIGLLRQYDQQGGSAVRVRIVNTERYTDAAEEAKRYGIEAQEVQSERAGRVTRDDIYLGIVVTSVDQQVVIPFFDRGTPVEYELTRSIRTVTESNRKTVGVLRTDAQVTGGFDMQNFRQLPEWRISTELKKQYDVKPVGPEELNKTDVDVLIAVMPSSLTDPEMINLVDYINRGKPTLIIDDPCPRFNPALAPKNPKPRPGGMGGMFGGGGPQQQKADNGLATKLTSALGIAWDSGQTVWDGYDPHPDFREWLDAVRFFDVVYISNGNGARYAFNRESRITRGPEGKGLQEIMMFYPGMIRPRDKSPLKFEPLLRSSPDSITYEWEEYVSSNFFGTAFIEPPPKSAFFDQTSPVIAAHITGPAESAPAGSNKEAGGKTPEINVVFVADMDMIVNELFFIRDKEWQGLKLDNITFILNSVDELAGEFALLDLRARIPIHRTLTRLEARTEAFKRAQAEEAKKADDEAKKNLADVSAKLDEEVNKILQNKSLDPRTQAIMAETARQNKRRVYEVEQANIENTKKRKIREAKEKSEREIRAIEGATQWAAILLPPIPALVLGIFVFAFRVKEERQGIVPDRLVSKKAA